MLKRTGFATFFSLVLWAGCATGTGSYSQDLDTTDTDEQSERCTRSVGDFDGTATPPPIAIPLGENVISAQDAIEAGQNSPEDARAGLLAEYATTLINVDAGVDLSEVEVDLLVSAEQLLIRTDGQSDYDANTSAELLDTVVLLGDLNSVLRGEVPCLEGADQQVLDVPVAPPAPDYNRPIDRRNKGLFLGTASADAPAAPKRDLPARL